MTWRWLYIRVVSWRPAVWHNCQLYCAAGQIRAGRSLSLASLRLPHAQPASGAHPLPRALPGGARTRLLGPFRTRLALGASGGVPRLRACCAFLELWARAARAHGQSPCAQCAPMRLQGRIELRSRHMRRITRSVAPLTRTSLAEMAVVFNTLDGILKEGWKHGPLGCLGQCDFNSVPCKTGAMPQAPKRACLARLMQRRKVPPGLRAGLRARTAARGSRVGPLGNALGDQVSSPANSHKQRLFSSDQTRPTAPPAGKPVRRAPARHQDCALPALA